MSIPPPDWLYEDRLRRRRGRGLLLTLVLLGSLGGGGWWLAEASPWAPQVRARWADSEPGRQVAVWQAQWAESPVLRWLDSVWALGDSGQRLARMAPASTRLYAEISPSWWTRLWMNTFKQTPSEEALTALRTWTRDQWKLDWDADVAPWTQPEMGMLGSVSGLEGTNVDAWSLWLGSGNDERAAACVAKLRDQVVAAGGTSREGHHGRTVYTVVTPVDGSAYALALLGGYLVMATPPRTIEGLIDQVEQGGPTLAKDNPRYRRVASAWPRGAVGHAFVDGGAESAKGSDPRLEAIGASMSSGSDWFTLEVTSAFDMAAVPPEGYAKWQAVVPPLDMRRFDRLPAATVLAVGATATPETTQWLSGPMALAWGPLGGAVGEGAVFSGLLAGLQTMKGPFAVGLVATSPDAEARDPVGAVFSLQPEDPEALRSELDRAAQTITSAGDPSRLPGPVGEWASIPWVKAMIPGVTSLAEENHGRDTWKVLRAGGQGLAGWTVSNHEVVLVGGDQALKLCQAERFEAISRTPGFDDVRRRLPAAPGLLVFADGQNAAHLLESSPWLPAKYAGQARRALKPLQAIGAAAAPGIDGRGFHHAALTAIITPAPNPGQ